jgi:hypothetical protein
LIFNIFEVVKQKIDISLSFDPKNSATHPIPAAENSFSTLFDLALVCKKPIEINFSADKISEDGGLLS